jgi:hypothetical protein
MFTSDPWYNGQGQQGGVQSMGFRPGPVQISVVRPAPMPAPTFGQVRGTAPVQQQTPLLAQAQPQQYAQQHQAPPPPPAPGAGPQNRIPMGQKGNCPVCRNFGG